jgi:hypothetical protein
MVHTWQPELAACVRQPNCGACACGNLNCGGAACKTQSWCGMRNLTGGAYNLIMVCALQEPNWRCVRACVTHPAYAHAASQNWRVRT